MTSTWWQLSATTWLSVEHLVLIELHSEPSDRKARLVCVGGHELTIRDDAQLLALAGHLDGAIKASRAK